MGFALSQAQISAESFFLASRYNHALPLADEERRTFKEGQGGPVEVQEEKTVPGS